MNPIRLLAMLLASALVTLLTGCATVTRGTKDSLVVESTPVGATVRAGNQVAQTPCSIKLSRKFEGPVIIEKAGYETVTVQVTSSPSTAGGAGMAGNVLVGGLIGAGLDVATGATNSLKPNPIQVTLVKVEPAPPSDAVGAPAEPAPVASPQPAETVVNDTKEMAPTSEAQPAQVSSPPAGS